VCVCVCVCVCRCVFYNVLVPGGHPFGEWFEREANIIRGKPDLSGQSVTPTGGRTKRVACASQAKPICVPWGPD
jgi:hypothetical protein